MSEQELRDDLRQLQQRYAWDRAVMEEQVSNWRRLSGIAIPLAFIWGVIVGGLLVRWLG